MQHEAQTGASTVTLPPPVADGPALRLARLWQQGQAPDLKAFLAQEGPLDSADLRAVLEVDQRERWRRGLGVPVDTYVQEHSLTDRETILDLIAREDQLRQQAGQAPAPQERTPWLTRYRELLDHLAPLPTCPSVTAPTLPPAQASTEVLPAAIGKYRVLALLGQGSQAQVYRAFHPDLGKDVVVKLGRAFPGAGGREALVAEGRALAQLDHPGLARIHDLDVHDGRPFLVMDYLPGRSLEQYAREKPVPPRQAAALMAQVAQAVGHAHRKGLLHRDLKPRNVLVGDDGRPCVIDFGLALLRDAWSGEPGHTEEVCGTVAYMAPEQALGRPADLDARTDVFGLGGILFFLLTGEAPFEADTLLGALERACQGDWGPSRLAASQVPRRLQDICRKALSPRPADRYASAADLAADLEAFARRPRPGPWLAAGLGGLTLLGLSLGVWIYTNPSPRPPTDDAARSPLALSDTPRLALGVWRRNRYRPLVEAVPLRAGSRLEVRAEVPAGFHATLFASSGGGSLEELARWQAAPADRSVRFPADSDQAVPLQGSGGTEIVLLCLRRAGPVASERLRALSSASPWPTLPDESVLRLLPGGVRYEQRTRDFGTPVPLPDPEGEVRRRLEQLRSSLRSEADFFEGIAFAHHPGPLP